VYFVYPHFNFGGCIAKVDPTPAGQACATAGHTADECSLAACYPYCPVDDLASLNAFEGQTTDAGIVIGPGCIGNASKTVCASYYTAANAACAFEFNDAGTGLGNACIDLFDSQDVMRLVATYCGGADAGL
jgi:hypothetical protein